MRRLRLVQFHRSIFGEFHCIDGAAVGEARALVAAKCERSENDRGEGGVQVARMAIAVDDPELLEHGRSFEGEELRRLLGEAALMELEEEACGRALRQAAREAGYLLLVAANEDGTEPAAGWPPRFHAA